MDCTIRQATQLLTDFNRAGHDQLTRREAIAYAFSKYRIFKRIEQYRQSWYEQTEHTQTIPRNGQRITLTQATEAMCRGIFLDKQ